MLKNNLPGVGFFVFGSQCKRKAHESRLQKFLCWLFGCCPD
jgi:hypothetical protein